MEAKLIADRRLWNEFVAATPTGHLCQTWEWAENSGEEAGSGSLRVGVMDGDRLVAAIRDELRFHSTLPLPLPLLVAPACPRRAISLAV